MTKYKVELVSKESELKHLKKDVAQKAAQISHLEESLQRIKSLLETKTDMGKLIIYIMDFFIVC